VSLLTVDFDSTVVFREVRRSGRRAPRDGSRGFDGGIVCSLAFYVSNLLELGESFREGSLRGIPKSPQSRVGTVQSTMGITLSSRLSRIVAHSAIGTGERRVYASATDPLTHIP
jgi:hypothetical protein